MQWKIALHVTGSLSSRCEELLFFNLYATFCDLVTAIIYCYITHEFHYAKRDSGLSAFGGVMLCNGLNLQRFVWEKR